MLVEGGGEAAGRADLGLIHILPMKFLISNTIVQFYFRTLLLSDICIFVIPYVITISSKESTPS